MFTEYSEKTINMRIAISSLQEELEAIQDYSERIEATDDQELKDILIHLRKEEGEHAAMLIEYIRRYDPGFGDIMKQHIFVEGEIVKH